MVLVMTVMLLASCASTTAERERRDAGPVVSPPVHTGEKTVVAVLPLGLSARAAERYSHLLEKSVGMGIHNLVLEALFDSGRFRFVETNPEVMKDVMERQWMGASGFVSQDQAVEYGRLLGARKVIYGEVYDYAEGGETVRGFSRSQGHDVKVGVQIFLVDISTSEKEALGTSAGVAPSYGDAAEMAVNAAVAKLVRRMP
ncbi:MAG: CsgG/HfaB family protein [Desulfatibacillaceae bacterium]